MALFNLFGFKIGKENDVKQDVLPSFSPPVLDDGAVTITAAAHYGTSIDLESNYKNDVELITRYREMAMQPEIESAVDDIINEALIQDDTAAVELILDDLKVSPKVKIAIEEEFKNILTLLNFKNLGQDIFRRFYVDGRLNYNIILDKDAPGLGIQELRYIDPRRLTKIREVQKSKDPTTGFAIVMGYTDYYIYSDNVTTKSNITQTGLKIAPDSIINVTSGLLDAKRSIILSYLHKAIKPLNQLRMIEDATIIYKVSRAPERRIFYIDVGSLPKMKAEQYLKDIMAKYKNKVVYDACLDMETLIPLLDGRTLSLTNIAKEFDEGKTLWVYSCNPETGEFAPGLVTNAGVTRKNAKVMKLTLDNGKSITCTPDHKFPVWNKGFIEAQDLIVGESMIPLDHQTSIKTKTIIENSSNTYKFTNTIISIEYLTETIDTGTLGIDNDEIYHNYHTFALASGIYTKNSTGQIRDDRNYLSMQDDFWLPRRSDSKTTEITTLPSSSTFDDMSMVEYFEKKLYKALSVPYSRLHQSETTFSMGRAQEISRDEVKFSKFITRLQAKFIDLFDQALRVQCILKGVCTDVEFDEYKQYVHYKFQKDNNYEELKEAELTQNRVSLLGVVDVYTGKYYSQQWIQKNILCMSDDDIKEIKDEIEQEVKDGLYPDPKLLANPDLGAPAPDQTQPDQTQPDQTQPDQSSTAPVDNTPAPADNSKSQNTNPYYGK